MKIKIVVHDAEREAFGPRFPPFQAAPRRATAWTNSCETFMKRLKGAFLWPNGHASNEQRAAPVHARRCASPATRGSAAHRIVLPQRNQHVADREPAAPDRVDHRMIGAGRGVRRCNGGIGAEMPGQVERQLHARRIFRKALVDAELEEESAVLMPQARCAATGSRRCEASRSRIGRSRQRGYGTADEGGVTVVLDQRGAALAFQPLAPAAGTSRARRRLPPACARRRNAQRRYRRGDGAGGAFLSFLAPSASRSNSSASRVASRQARRRDCSTRGRKPCSRSTSPRVRMAAPSSETSRRISACAPVSRACRSNRARRRALCRIEQRRAQRAVGMGADQSGQRDLVGARHRTPASGRSSAPHRRAQHRSMRPARKRRHGRWQRRSPPAPGGQ